MVTEHPTPQHVVIPGDCLDVMRSFADASVDAIVTDPPYGLGFMGKAWDDLPPGLDFAREALRVLKPGGHMLAFGGTRTWHRLAVAVEDAGFEIRDSIAWLYGCLTADADVLTDRGWVNGLGVREGDLVAQWDHDTGRITLAPVERTFRAPWDGPMRVLRSSDTDQVLTPNHRVYHQTYEREQVAGARTGSWSAWQVAEAGSLSTWQPVRLPVAGTHDGPGIGGEDYAALLGWVWTEGGFDQSGTGVRIYQSSVNPEKCDEIAALLDRMGPHKRYDYARTYTRRNGQAHQYTATTWLISGDIANRVREDLPGKRPTYDLLWRMTAAEKRAMLRAAMLGDGSGWGGSSPQFYQKHEDDLVWLQTLLALIDQAGKVTMRGDRQGGQLSLRQRGTTDLQARHLRPSTEHYTGEVWCVKVPSGAFVARRNGRVFITGNSGFPKSLDVSKAIDKAAGAERSVVGVAGKSGAARSCMAGDFAGGEYMTTAPATPEAAAWSGWGTAMKPAWEGVVWATKAPSLIDRIGSRLEDLEWQCRQHVSDAARSSRLTHPGLPEVTTGSVHGHAATQHEGAKDQRTPTGEVVDSSALTDTQWSEWTASTCLNTVTSWSDCWAELSEPTSTSTTSTTSETTTDLATLWSYLSKITDASTHLTDPTSPDGLSSHARSVDNLFAAALLTWRATREPTATEPATSPTQQTCLEDHAQLEPIVVARKPLAGTVAANVLAHGTGALNIDGCRIESTDSQLAAKYASVRNAPPRDGTDARPRSEGNVEPNPGGRWPANVVLDEDQAAALDEQSGASTSRVGKPRGSAKPGEGWGMTATGAEYNDKGGASRFFYVAKAPKRERPVVDGVAHPTVKPLALMRWLVRLVTPPGGIVLDPFAGSGTTVEAAVLEGFDVLAIEREADYLPLIEQRIRRAAPQPTETEETVSA